jgi:hypothetical protein
MKTIDRFGAIARSLSLGALLFYSAIAARGAAPVAADITKTPIPKEFFGLHYMIGSDPKVTVTFGSVRFLGSGQIWDKIEAQKGTIRFDILDRYVAAAQKRKIDSMYTFTGTPIWSAPKKTLPPKNMQDLYDFAHALALRYKGRIAYYEGWNEPNVRNIFYDGSILDLIRMQKAIYDAVKSADPAAKVLSPAIAGLGSDPLGRSSSAIKYFDDYLAAGGGAYCDILAFHDHTADVPETAFFAVVASLRKVFAQHGQSAKPLWCTEGSWHTKKTIETFTDQDEQAARLSRYYILHWALGVERFYWYHWDHPWGRLSDNNDGATRKAAIAYDQTAKWLIGATMVTPCVEHPKDGIYCCVLTRPNGYRAKILWKIDGDADYRPESEFKRMRDLDGATKPLNGGKVTIGKKPILLETGPAF